MPRFPISDPQQAYHQGYGLGQSDAANAFSVQLQQAIDQVRQEVAQSINRTAGGVRKEARDELDRRMAAVAQQVEAMSKIADALRVSISGQMAGPVGDPGITRIESVPGKRIPYVMLVEVPIDSADLAQKEQTAIVSMDGPFVAVRRWATFLSDHQFQVTDPSTGNVTTLPGRSNGRFRPPHSAADVNDGMAHYSQAGQWYIVEAGAAPPVGALFPSAVLALPSSHASFRTMEFDGKCELRDDGSQFPRQNKAIPSAWWACNNNDPVELGALDFYAQGTTISFKVQPNHILNPAYGNAFGAAVFPNAAVPGFPFSAGQFDPHEGIATPNSVTRGAGGVTDYVPVATDSITRLPTGYFIMALEGYRIIQTSSLST